MPQFHGGESVGTREDTSKQTCLEAAAALRFTVELWICLKHSYFPALLYLNAVAPGAPQLCQTPSPLQLSVIWPDRLRRFCLSTCQQRLKLSFRTTRTRADRQEAPVLDKERSSRDALREVKASSTEDVSWMRDRTSSRTTGPVAFNQCISDCHDLHRQDSRVLNKEFDMVLNT